MSIKKAATKQPKNCVYMKDGEYFTQYNFQSKASCLKNARSETDDSGEVVYVFECFGKILPKEHKESASIKVIE